MKKATLLVILFMSCSYLFAQDSIPFIDGSSFNYRSLITINEDSSEVTFYGVELLTVKLILQYADERYNDSTYERVHIYPNESVFINSTDTTTSPHSTLSTISDMCYSYGDGCVNPDHYKYKWFHKQPTFPDFVQWIRKKYNK